MSIDPHASTHTVDVPRLYRIAAFTALGWAAVLMVRALYNCFAVVGPMQFLLGIFYYGSHGGSGQAETSSFDYAILYGLGALFTLRGSHWARGLVCGVAAVEGYNRLRSLTGALFDPAQRPWFTGQLQGQLLLATLVLGVLVTVALVLMLSRRVGQHVPWQPPPSPWTAAAVQANMQQQAFAAQTAQPQPQQAYGGQPYLAPAMLQQTGPAAPYASTQPQAQSQQQVSPQPAGYGYPQQPQPQPQQSGYGYPQQPQPQPQPQQFVQPGANPYATQPAAAPAPLPAQPADAVPPQTVLDAQAAAGPAGPAPVPVSDTATAQLHIRPEPPQPQA